jgi:hypothetical protein
VEVRVPAAARAAARRARRAGQVARVRVTVTAGAARAVVRRSRTVRLLAG